MLRVTDKSELSHFGSAVEKSCKREPRGREVLDRAARRSAASQQQEKVPAPAKWRSGRAWCMAVRLWPSQLDPMGLGPPPPGLWRHRTWSLIGPDSKPSLYFLSGPGLWEYYFTSLVLLFFPVKSA